MTKVSHQTIKLGRGKHSSPESGACVMELASMLAGERFSDHPRAVSRVIGAFLRGYNDMLDDARRQDLYEYAARVVGTASRPEVEELRLTGLLGWADELRQVQRTPWRRFMGPRISRARRREPEAVGTYAVRVIPGIDDATHRLVLRMVDELISIGAETLRESPSQAMSRLVGRMVTSTT